MFRILPILFFALVQTARLPAAAPLPEAVSACPAPAPINLSIIEVTPTTISLAWISTTSGLYHQVKTYDITAGVWLSNTYVTTDAAVIDSLTPGNCYRFEVSSSYCENGPFGLKAEREGCAGIIIIETVLEIQEPPTLVPGPKTNAGTTLEYCLAQSTSAEEPFTNAFVGALTYGNQALEFGLALTPDHYLHFGPTSNGSFFTFDTQNSGALGRCKLGNTVVFTVQYQEDSPVVGIGQFVLSFVSSCSGFKYGGSVQCSGMRQGHSGETALLEALDHDQEAQIRNAPLLNRASQAASRLLPNPFSQSATLYCEMAEAGPLTVSLFDAQGRLLRVTEERQAQAGPHIVVIPGDDLPEGVYFIGVQTAQNREMLPLVKRE